MRGLYALKPWYSRRLDMFVRGAVRRGLSPDLFTFVGIIGACLAAVAVAYAWWPLVILFLAIRLAGANLDGAVARAREVSRPWGFVLNEIGDRLSDLVVMGGLAVLAWRTDGVDVALVVVIAAVAATLPTFASLAAAGAGATRRNGGPLGKTERCLLVIIASIVPAWTIWIAWIIVAGSLVTAVTRLIATHRELSAA
ncbi:MULTISPECIES: CDP-alcohol phosphatidyltransferase family protein [Aeromicrobium]|uniref:CDP-alcohol phosphatidyltransferase family protein n=1 Tax=Aeromicrobium piscarium TaxID=2590901 RepID=A0A554S6Z0_9ACTN|nr:MULTISPECIES: CDP-alcohol phosphatidyltransferase family protein [Aeromicrobium]OUZ09711.1 CDP-alcohol phosphatidyltransferase [Aeromicrobium sp. PE09-221]TSD62123.1 CDP-alcohol phosphatidyltransferase family protein [Aeromicrobium piscarium]